MKRMVTHWWVAWYQWGEERDEVQNQERVMKKKDAIWRVT